MCKFCNDTGIAEFVDLAKLKIQDGSYELTYLLDKYGEFELCTECTINTKDINYV